LWDAEQGGNFAVFQVACVESFIDREREASLDLPFGGIGIAHVGEDVGGTAGNRGQGVLRRSSSAWARFTRSVINGTSGWGVVLPRFGFF